jgi:hypothetical protein
MCPALAAILLAVQSKRCHKVVQHMLCDIYADKARLAAFETLNSCHIRRVTTVMHCSHCCVVAAPLS